MASDQRKPGMLLVYAYGNIRWSTAEGMEQEWRPGSSLNLMGFGEYSYEYYEMERQESDWFLRI